MALKLPTIPAEMLPPWLRDPNSAPGNSIWAGANYEYSKQYIDFLAALSADAPRMRAYITKYPAPLPWAGFYSGGWEADLTSYAVWIRRQKESKQPGA